MPRISELTDGGGASLGDQAAVVRSAASRRARVNFARLTNIAAMTALTGMSDNDTVEVLGYSNEGDGGGGTFFWDAASTATEDSGTIFAADAGGTGRWVRSYSGPVNVRWFGAKVNGSTDDTAAIQAMFNAGVRECVFAAGETIVSAALTFPSGVLIRGESLDPANGSIIKVDAGANLDGVGVLTAKAWDDSASNAGAPVLIRDLFINGNRAAQTAGTADGVLLMNYRSIIENVHIFGMTGNGLSIRDQNKAGVTLSGTAVENRITRCTITQCDGDGVFVQSSGSILTDGKIHDCVIGSVGGNGINCLRSAGWQFYGNQIYNIGLSAIVAGAAFNTSVFGNAIQGFGTSANTGVYHGVFAGGMSNADRAVLIASNQIVQNITPVAGTTYQAIRVTAGTGVSDAHVFVHGNSVTLNNDPSESFFTCGGNGSVLADVFNNSARNLPSGAGIVPDATTHTVRHRGNTFDLEAQELAGNATPSVVAGSVFTVPNATITLSNLDDGFEGQVVRVLFNQGTYTVDFTGTNLKGNGGGDWSPSAGDHMTCTKVGAEWFCDVSDNTA